MESQKRVGHDLLTKQQHIPTTTKITEVHNTNNTKRWWGYRAQETHLLLVGMQNGTATLEDSLASFLQN